MDCFRDKTNAVSFKLLLIFVRIILNIAKSSKHLIEFYFILRLILIINERFFFMVEI